LRNPKSIQQSKSPKPGHFASLEAELFAWFRRNETKHATLTDDIIAEKAKLFAAQQQIHNFQALKHWISRFKKRNGISQIVLHGEAGSADEIYVEIARAMLPSYVVGLRVMPIEIPVARDDGNVMQELAALLVDFSTHAKHERMSVEDLLNPAEERWTEPPVESDDEDADLVQAIRDRPEENEEDAYDSEPHVPLTLKEARELFVKSKRFLQDNQSDLSLQKYLVPVESLVRALETMNFAARTRQTSISQFFLPRPATDGAALGDRGARAY
jgi:hypothetical protein